MIPKVIHLCWFSNDPYPVEIKICLATWAKYLPDYKIRLWSYADAEAIGCEYINQALKARKWAFAADVVRFYAIYSEGGIYMDSDVMVHRRFDEFIPTHGFATFQEEIENILPQAAFLIGEKGNRVCKALYEYYLNRPFILPDGTYDQTISPVIMAETLKQYGYTHTPGEQRLAEDIIIYDGKYVTPRNARIIHHPDAIALHTIYGSWRKRRFGRKIELQIRHLRKLFLYYTRYRAIYRANYPR